jgi:hypothetical protein
MIEQQIDLQTVAAQNFGVKMRSDASLHFIPTDVGTKAVLTDVLNATIGAFNGIDGDWQAYDISEDYGEPRRIFAARNAEHFGLPPIKWRANLSSGCRFECFGFELDWAYIA